MSSLAVETTGDEELVRAMYRIADQLSGGPEMNAWATDTSALLLRESRLKAPTDTGAMRARFLMAVLQKPSVTEAVAGSKMERAVWQEEGTPPHWPPPGALEVWARRHGWTDYTIRRHISQHGTKAKWMFRDALEENIRTIFAWLGRTIGGILTNG
jgi:hypothetical protein